MKAASAIEEPTEHRARANGIELAWFEWNAARRGRGPTILLLHATGFHARCWDPVVRHLGEHHVVAVDLRGHGRSEKTEIVHWEVFGQDVVALARALDLGDLVGVGHSMGGHTLVDAAWAEPARYRRLVLIDPVIVAPETYAGVGWTLPEGFQHPTARRRRYFASPEAMIERFHDRPPYAAFHPEALASYCRHGLLPRADGEDGFELACPPETEASIYMTSRTNTAIHERAAALELPVLVLRAKLPPAGRSVMDFASSPTWPELVTRFRRGRDVHYADRSHFLPMETPDAIAETILGEVRAAEGDPT